MHAVNSQIYSPKTQTELEEFSSMNSDDQLDFIAAVLARSGDNHHYIQFLISSIDVSIELRKRHVA